MVTSKQIFVSLPVKDLNRSTTFYKKLGFEFKTTSTSDHATCMVIGPNIFVMLLTEGFFKTFTRKEICDATKTTEVLLALSADSREQVDLLNSLAIEAGATTPLSPQDHGWMYQRCFQDLDGHVWEIVFIDTDNYHQSKKKFDMKITDVPNDIEIFYLTAKSFPDGIQEAHERIHALIGSLDGRTSYGISHADASGNIVYMAGVSARHTGEGQQFGCKTFVAKKGRYFEAVINNYMRQPEAIGDVFQEMMSDPRIDPQGACVEEYISNTEMRCLVRLA